LNEIKIENPKKINKITARMIFVSLLSQNFFAFIDIVSCSINSDSSIYLSLVGFYFFR
jgi:hypothetical protein